ncbi:MAG: ATP cone domain-containing protein [bacterium]|nr:ATP cone domain-containing protein [bacterium]MDZ4231650.1 ATP cone domain-containing protein [Candidatus Pacearchaeota archaeon]
MKVTKATGETEEYSSRKLEVSLARAGAGKDVVRRVLEEVRKELRPGVSTDAIHKAAASRLLKESSVLAARYSLKRAIMEFGPQGFFFEQFMEAVLREYGYKTKRGQMMRGKCVSHEIDIMADKENTHYICELKYHNTSGTKTDVEVAMYLRARLEDIVEFQSRLEPKGIGHVAWLLTNTKFTSKAIKYGSCRGLRMTGWHYPKTESLERLIEDKRLYPVTVLPSINHYAKESLARGGVLFARDILFLDPETLERRFGIHAKNAKKIMEDAYDLTVA